jgi:hypothetical protein
VNYLSRLSRGATAIIAEALLALFACVTSFAQNLEPTALFGQANGCSGPARTFRNFAYATRSDASKYRESDEHRGDFRLEKRTKVIQRSGGRVRDHPRRHSSLGTQRKTRLAQRTETSAWRNHGNIELASGVLTTSGWRYSMVERAPELYSIDHPASPLTTPLSDD